MKVEKTAIPGVLLIEPQVFGDHRGFFLETYRQPRYRELGIEATFVQDNMSLSKKGVLRGLHAQYPKPQAKLISVIYGSIFDVAVDIRVGSPTFGQWYGVVLDGTSKRQLYVPPGLAHGFCVTSDEALVAYKCSEIYAPENEFSMLWNDPQIGIEWPEKNPVISQKDIVGIRLADLPQDRLMKFHS